MKDDGKSQKEDLILSKESCRIDTWNVRTMNESTKIAQIFREMTSYNATRNCRL